MLPRVCTRWARILRRPSAVWEDTDIDLEALYTQSNIGAAPGRPPLAVDAVSTWFGRCSALSVHWGGKVSRSTAPQINPANQ